jgi:hypothetical protein
MKNVIFAMLVLGMVVGVQADLLSQNGIDGDMETAIDDGFGSMRPDPGYGVWASAWDNIDHEWLDISDGTDTYTPPGSIPYANDGTTPQSGSYMWMLAGGNASPSVGHTVELDVEPGDVIRVGAWIKADDNNPPSNVEFGFDQIYNFGWLGSDAPAISITNEWAYYEYTSVVWENANQIKAKVATFGTTAAQDGVLYTDNWTVVNVTKSGQAINPNPADGADVPLNLATLSWTTPDPVIDPNGIVTCDVIFGTDPNFLTTPSTATGITDGTVDLSELSPTVTLADGPTYYWRVDSNDPNAGGIDVVTPSAVWSFQVGDLPPVVDAGLNQYVYLSGGTATFTLSGSYTDDGKSPITRAEFVEGAHETAPETIVTYGTKVWTPGAGTHTSGTVTQEITVDGNGWFAFDLEVEDTAGIGVDEGVEPVVTPHDEPGVRAGVYGTCAEAATEDPDDSWDTTGDIDGDCDKDLADFALLAADWLGCNAAKTACP